jgi:hypothetical protein
MKDRIMYIEDKSGGLSGPARIGRVRFSKTRKSLYYKDKVFHRLSGQGYKANHFAPETGAEYWISGCRDRRGRSGGVLARGSTATREHHAHVVSVGG